MRLICCFVVSLLLSNSSLGAIFVIGEIHDCNYLYTLMIRTAINTIYKEQKLYISCNDSIALVSYGVHQNVPFEYVCDNQYLKRKGKYHVYLTINQNSRKEIIKAYFIIKRNRKKIAHVSLIQV